jgi:hypothetical protein
MRINKLAAGVIGAAALGVLAISAGPANAQVPYLGVDFGNGWGIGVGAPPSAYGMAVASPLYPFYAPYYYPPRHYHYRRY